MSRLLDPAFKWTGSASVDVTETWRKHGFRPTTDSERRARRKPKPMPANVRALPKRAKG